LLQNYNNERALASLADALLHNFTFTILKMNNSDSKSTQRAFERRALRSAMGSLFGLQVFREGATLHIFDLIRNLLLSATSEARQADLYANAYLKFENKLLKHDIININENYAQKAAKKETRSEETNDDGDAIIAKRVELITKKHSVDDKLTSFIKSFVALKSNNNQEAEAVKQAKGQTSAKTVRPKKAFFGIDPCFAAFVNYFDAQLEASEGSAESADAFVEKLLQELCLHVDTFMEQTK
jgi:hypothetical protein